MEYPEKPKHSEHDSRPFLVVAGLITVLLWYASLGCPATLWLKPPSTESTPVFNIACVVTPVLVIAGYLLYHSMKFWEKVILALFSLATCVAVTWIVFVGALTRYGPCEPRSKSTQVCLMYDPDNAYAYTFASPDSLPLIMIRTGYAGTAWEENADCLLPPHSTSTYLKRRC